jgi:hypothetical protein
VLLTLGSVELEADPESSTGVSFAAARVALEEQAAAAGAGGLELPARDFVFVRAGAPVGRKQEGRWQHELYGGGGGDDRDKSDCHFRITATEYDRKPGIQWLSCTTM